MAFQDRTQVAKAAAAGAPAFVEFLDGLLSDEQRAAIEAFLFPVAADDAAAAELDGLIRRLASLRRDDLADELSRLRAARERLREAAEREAAERGAAEPGAGGAVRGGEAGRG